MMTDSNISVTCVDMALCFDVLHSLHCSESVILCGFLVQNIWIAYNG
jgi:hypothetical protein